ncbi:MAG: polysaccharide deacetylase family protein, partial [Cyclobacteriaceae bacterium]|nr:polysaccharide deacetylase family protein [Cyclobacteriaceae bacterium]
MNIRLISAILFVSTIMLFSCGQQNKSGEADNQEPASWAEKLGYPAGKKVIMLHIDDAGMSEEANIATKKYLLDGHVQSAAVMPPCPKFEEMIEWAKEHPQMDVGLHLTLTSEWKNYRWPSVSPVDEVPGLIDEEGMLWHDVPDVVQHATAEEVEKEIRAQIDKSIAMGYQPDHIDTHMGTLYGHQEYTKAFLKAAMDYDI